MSRNSEQMAAVLERCRGRDQDPHYLAYFECFNQGLFFEAHEVLEVLWLGQRAGPHGAFYKGLIQLAGAFVHLQKHRPEPARALLQLALGNLEPYPARYEQLELTQVRNVIGEGLRRLATEGTVAEWVAAANGPRLSLQAGVEKRAAAVSGEDQGGGAS